MEHMKQRILKAGVQDALTGLAQKMASPTNPLAILKQPHRYTPKPGFDWNPLRQFPRNSPCWCGSKLKAKRCHLNDTPELVELKRLPELKALVALAQAGAR